NGPKGIYGRRSLSKPPKPTILDLSYRPHHKRLPRQRFSAMTRYGTGRAVRCHASSPVPTANPKPLTATANRLILAADERSLQVDLVRLDWTVQVAGCVGSRDPGPSTPTQRAAAQIPEAIGVRQY